MSVTVNASNVLDVTETLETSASPASESGSSVVRGSAYSVSNQSLTASTTPKVDAAVDLSVTLSGSTEVVDLTAAPELKDINDSVDLTGKELVGIIFEANASNNASGCTVEADSTNGYNVLGASGKITLFPGMTMSFFIRPGSAAPFDAVGASDKRILFTGTSGDNVNVLAVFGTQS